MLSLHLLLNGKETEAYWPARHAVTIEYSGPEGANLYFTEDDGKRGARIEMDGKLIEALYWHYMQHTMPPSHITIEVKEPEPPF